MKRLYRVAAVWAFTVVGYATDAVAAENASQAQRAREEVQVYLVGPVHTPALETLLREWFASEGQPVRIALQRSVIPNHVLEANDGPPLRAWVVLHQRHDVRIIFADAEQQRFFVRDVPLDNGLDEVGREKLAQVLLASSQAFADHRVEETPLEQVKQALSEPETQRRPQKVSAPAASGSDAEAGRLSWALSAGYTAAYRGPAGFAHGPAATFEAWFDRETWSLGLAAGGRYELPHTETGEQVELSVQNTALRLGVLFASIGDQRPVWLASLGLGWDWLEFRPVRGEEGVTLHASDTTQRPVACVGFGRFARFGELRLGATLGVEIAFAKLHYDVIISEQQQRTLTPWQIYPHAALSLGWH